MFVAAARQGQAADSTVVDEVEASDDEDDARSRAELQPRLSGDEVVAAEAIADRGTSSEMDEVRPCRFAYLVAVLTGCSLFRANLQKTRRHHQQTRATRMKMMRSWMISIMQSKTSLIGSWLV